MCLIVGLMNAETSLSHKRVHGQLGLSDADITVFWTFRPATVYHHLCAYEQKIQFFIVFEKAVDSSCIVQVMQLAGQRPAINVRAVHEGCSSLGEDC